MERWLMVKDDNLTSGSVNWQCQPVGIKWTEGRRWVHLGIARYAQRYTLRTSKPLKSANRDLYECDGLAWYSSGSAGDVTDVNQATRIADAGHDPERITFWRTQCD